VVVSAEKGDVGKCLERDQGDYNYQVKIHETGSEEDLFNEYAAALMKGGEKEGQVVVKMRRSRYSNAKGSRREAYLVDGNTLDR
jgi:hypothetical protein